MWKKKKESKEINDIKIVLRIEHPLDKKDLQKVGKEHLNVVEMKPFTQHLYYLPRKGEYLLYHRMYYKVINIYHHYNDNFAPYIEIVVKEKEFLPHEKKTSKILVDEFMNLKNPIV